MDPNKKQPLVNAIVKEFKAPVTLRDWVGLHIPGDNVHNILTAGAFDAQVLELVNWAEANGPQAERDLLQLMCDHSPTGSRQFHIVINWVSDGQVKLARLAGPPVEAHKDWFVTQRPFANRVDLRGLLATFGTAAPGPNSILIIEGPKLSGKTLGVRLAAQCAPPHEVVSVDVHDWGTNQMYAWDLAGAIYPEDVMEIDPSKYDPTKEEAAVPQLLTWLKGKLKKAPQIWILFDHCSKPNLTAAACTLLHRLAATVEGGFLPNVRLVIADIDVSKLPSLRGRSRWDTATLPDRSHVSEWCTTLATHLDGAGLLKKPCSAAELEELVDSVFEGLREPTELAVDLESRLTKVFEQIKAH
ncbi:MAG: hypothetical protein ACKVXR_04905 [Planctomycetota bacterium]